MVSRRSTECLNIWLVKPKDGRVRKIKLSPLSLGFLGFIFALGFATFFYIAGDYARQAVLRFKSEHILSQMMDDHQNLVVDFKALEGKLKNLETEAQKSEALEGSLASRLEKLKDAVKFATTLGVIKKEDVPILSGESGVGGKEIDCAGDNCSFLLDGQPAVESSLAAPKSNDEVVQELDRLIDALRRAPIGGPSDARVSSGYGLRLSPFTGHISKHEGMDYALPYGAEAKVTASGTVSAVKYHSEYGLYVDVEHNKDLSTRYAHLSKALVKEGQKVARGSVIGLVGSSGAVTGPHLHYEVRVKGVAMNPESVIALGKKLNSVL